MFPKQAIAIHYLVIALLCTVEVARWPFCYQSVLPAVWYGRGGNLFQTMRPITHQIQEIHLAAAAWKPACMAFEALAFLILQNSTHLRNIFKWSRG